MQSPPQDAAIGSAAARGKVILLGEHAVVYGRPALAAAIDLSLHVRIVPGAAPLSSAAPEAVRLRAALARVGALMSMPWTAPRVEIDSHLPPGVGLGSSAALSVALVRAAADCAGAQLADADVCAHAYELERIFHGFPSGIDNTVATYGGCIRFQVGRPPVFLQLPHPLSIVVAISRTPRATAALVGGLRERIAAHTAAYAALFDAIQSLVHRAEAALLAGDLPVLGTLMSANHEILGQLGISTQELDEMVAFAGRHGAFGAKVTGGGGGGAIIAVCAEPDALASVFEEAGWHAFTARIGAEMRTTHVPQNSDIGTATLLRD